MEDQRFVLVTPVKDEVRTIGQTIDAVVRQTVKPAEWVIVSDGSTDGTNELVASAAEVHPWIKLIALPGSPVRSFAAVVHNTERGVAALTCSDYRYIGLLDADLNFQQDYFELLLARFESNPALGLAGGVVIDPGRPKDRFPRNRIDVPGAVQMFSRECFEKLGGLIAIPEGGWDCLTCAMARMAGYQTELVTDLVVDHLKPRNISQGGILGRTFQLGVRDYAIGYHPLFELAKCIGRWREPPLCVAATAHFAGYCMATAQRRPRIVPENLVAFVRQEQSARLFRH
jgi:glycosyltransferase involved in cell wall biosynthesis